MAGWAGWNGGGGAAMPDPTYTGTFAWDPAAYQNNPAYQSRMADVNKEVTRGALAKGTAFTNQAREDLAQRAGQVSAQYQDADFGRAKTLFDTNYGVASDNYSRGAANVNADRAWDTEGYRRFDTDRNFDAGRSDTQFGQNRLSSLDANARDQDLWNRGRTSQLDAWTRSDNVWNQWRTDSNDQWGRGLDTWQMGRTDRNDLFNNNVSLSDMILRNRPQPL